MRKITKKIVGIFLVAFFLVRTVGGASAIEDASSVSLDVNYEAAVSGETKVKYKVELTNNTTEAYASGFELLLTGMHPEKIRAYDGERDFDYEVSESEGGKRLLVKFAGEPLVGKGIKRTFYIDFIDKSLVEKTGEVWEVTVPGVEEMAMVDDYNLEIVVPKEFGNLAYLAPEPMAKTESDKSWHYYFGLEDINQSSITAAFGEFQVFSFELLYHLENPINSKSEIEVAIPPDTAFQKVIFQKLEPMPVDVRVDEDGNWLAKYILKPRERVDLKVDGSVQIYAKPRAFTMLGPETRQKNTRATSFWQSDSEEIKKIASELSNPKEIYNYVVDNLIYDYERVRPNNRRVGALGVLADKSATCMEFTDLFVALARAKGIPAREVNGYVYTENPELQPLSLVADVLHSWPEYWDDKTQIWTGVDPTWGNTTGGVEFFTKLDLRHFVFVIHGVDAEKPYPPGSYKLGPNPQKDVLVQFGKLPELRSSKLEVQIEKGSRFPVGKVNYKINFYNPGPVAVYERQVEVKYDGRVTNEFEIPAVPPFGSYVREVSVPMGFLGTGLPMEVSVEVDGEIVSVSTDKEVILVSLLIVVLMMIFGIAVWAMRRYRRARKH